MNDPRGASCLHPRLSFRLLKVLGWTPLCIVCKRAPATHDNLWCEEHQGWVPGRHKRDTRTPEVDGGYSSRCRAGPGPGSP